MQAQLLENGLSCCSHVHWQCMILCISLHNLASKKYSYSGNILTISFNYVNMLINFQLRAGTFLSKAIMHLKLKAYVDKHLLNI